MTDGPKAVWSGSFKLFGIDVKCHTLDDGRRIIDADSMGELMAAFLGQSEPTDADNSQRFYRWYRGFDQ